MGTAERIKELCSKKKITIAKLERELGFGNGTIVKSASAMRSDRLKAIADYFGVTMEYLMEGDTALLSGSGNSESAAEKQQELTEDEAELLAIFRYLTDKALLLDYARMLKDREKASGVNALNVG